MVFSTTYYLFLYLPLVLLIYYITPLKLRNLALLAVSLLFYYWGERIYVLIMFASTFIDYFHGMLVERCKGRGNLRGAKLAVASSIVFNLALLGFFKYWDFIAGSLQAVGLTFMPVLGHPPAHRHLFLYLPNHELYHRCLPRGYKSPAKHRQLRHFCHPVSSADCRPHHQI